MRPARSLLLVAADRLDLLDRPQSSLADAILVELPAGRSGEAARELREPMARRPGRRWFLRTGASRLGADLPALDGVAVEAVLVGGLASAEDVRTAVASIDGAGLAAGIVPLIDSARAAFLAHEIVAASPRVASLCFDGSEHGELVADLACAWSIDGPELIFARQFALLAARAAGIACPLDGPFADPADRDGLARDTGLSRRLGYRGRVVVDPAQIEAVNRIYSPTRDEIDHHRRVLARLDEALAEGRASVTLDGKMIDYAHAETARAAIEQARLWGLAP